ncbi:MAG: CPBP family intramembrane glutamic endopeptidase [Bacteroidota bacterium]
MERIKGNPLTFSLLVLLAVMVLYVGYRHDTLTRGIAYLSVMWLFSFFIDVYALRYPPKNDFVVRNAKRETGYFILCLLLGMVFLYFRFSGNADWQHLNPLARLAIIPLIVFVFPIALAIIMLLSGYKPKEQGIRLQGLVMVIPILLISFLTNRIVSPESLTWNRVIDESGSIIGAIYSGLILAGLSEEFFRVIGQTRMGALMKNMGYGWLITSTIWAFMHAPKWYGEEHDLKEALLSSTRIIPIGLMWGYLTHRTKSILPSVVVHGFNFWGLQNF